MRKSRFSDQQIARALQQVEHGASVAVVCRKLGISEQTYYRWKKRFGEMAPSEIKKMKQLEDENRRLKVPDPDRCRGYPPPHDSRRAWVPRPRTSLLPSPTWRAAARSAGC